MNKSFLLYSTLLVSVDPIAMCSLVPLQAHMAHLPPQGHFRHFMDMKVEKRLAGWKERCSRFGDIDMHKCCQFGQIFSPFQALATMVSSSFVMDFK
jgi:hypothetical protein